MKRWIWIVLISVLLLVGVSPALAGNAALLTATLSPTATLEGGTATHTPTPPPPTNTPTPNETKAPAVIQLIVHEPTPVGYGPEDYPYNINPLTGLAVADPAILERRPMVVKITNYPRSVRPQSGLSRADIIYEYYMERGIPRFIAIFYGQDAEYAGPVRSGRFFDEHIFKMYDGIFVYGSADIRILNYFLDLGVHWRNSFVLENQEQRDTPCAEDKAYVLCRDRTVETYNNLYVNTDKLERYIFYRNSQYRPDLTGMRFTYRTPLNGTVALSIKVRYSLFIYNKWEYDFIQDRYIRFQETVGYQDSSQEFYAPHLDKLTGEQLAADNVVVISVPIHWFVKTKTTEILNIPLHGSGEAVVFRDGYAFTARWVRPDETSILQLFTLDGQPFPLKPGTTWFQVISPESEVTQDPTGWRFVFAIPPVPDKLEENPINPNAENPPYGWFEDKFSPAANAAATKQAIAATQDALEALTPTVTPTPEN